MGIITLYDKHGIEYTGPEVEIDEIVCVQVESDDGDEMFIPIWDLDNPEGVARQMEWEVNRAAEHLKREQESYDFLNDRYNAFRQKHGV